MLHPRATAGRERHADDRVATRESIQRVRVDVRELLRLGHSALVAGGSHPDLRGRGRHSTVQHVALEGAYPETDPLLLAGGQRLSVEGRLSRQSHERRAHEQIAQHSELTPRSAALDSVLRAARYTRPGHRRAGSEHEGREHVLRRDRQR